MIPVLKPLLPKSKSLLQYLNQIDERRIYSNFGPLQDQLTNRLADYFGVSSQNVLLVSNGTLALAGAVATASASSKKTWTIPNWTFVATAHSVLLANARFRLADINPSTWFLDPSQVSLDENSIFTAPFGANPFDDGILPFQTNDFFQIIDAASCFDSLRNCGPRMRPNQILMVSLHATKLVSTGEGGLLIGPEEWIRDARRWINFGFFNNRIATAPAINGKMSEYAAAVGCASLDHWAETRSKLRLQLIKYQDLISNLGWKLQPSAKDGWCTSTLNVQFESQVQKNYAMKKLKESSVDHREWWGNGINSLPWISKSDRAFPATELCASTTLGLPFFVDLNEVEFSLIAEIFRKIKANFD